VLLFLEHDSIPFQISVLDSLLGLESELRNLLLFFFVQRQLLLLVFQQGHKMVVFLGPRVQLLRAIPQRIFAVVVVFIQVLV